MEHYKLCWSVIIVLNHIKSIIENGVKVEVKGENQHGQYPVLVQDITEGSLTKGWTLIYYPRLYTTGYERLYDGKETFSQVQIANFSSVYNFIMELDRRFANGDGVEVLPNQKRIARYEYNTALVVAQEAPNSVEFRLSITDSKSPFHMLGVVFRVMDSKKDGSRHLIGADDRWDRNTDIFTENNAYMSPRKKRVLVVYQEENNSIPYVRANSRMGMNNITQVDPNNSEFIYVHDISNEYRALAFIYEQNILRIALDKALEQIHKQKKEADNAFSIQTNFMNPFASAQDFVSSQNTSNSQIPFLMQK